MANIKITEGISEEHLADIYSDPYILRAINNDYSPSGPVIHPLIRYFSTWIDGSFSGAFVVVEFSWVEWDLHSLLKKSAIKHSRALGRAFINHVFSINTELLRLTAYVIEGLESARNYCLRLGFKYEGTRRSAFLVNGEPKDCYILGLLKSEWVTP